MPFIGKQPQVGAYSKLDAITTSATATYNLTLNSGAYYPSSANHLMVSLNGVMQAPQDSFTISGATIIFASTLASTDSIDFIMALGDVLDIGTPSDGTVVTAKMQDAAVTTAKIADANITTGKLASSLDLSGKTVTYGLTDSDMPSGSVLQVVQATSNTATEPNTSWTNIAGASVTITPSSTSSKVLVTFNTGGMTNGIADNISLKMLRGSTSIRVSSRYGYQSMSGWAPIHLFFTYLDSPSTTSSTEYTIQIKTDVNNDFRINDDQENNGGVNGLVIIATEIAG